MASQPDQDVTQRLQQLEAELQQGEPIQAPPPSTPPSTTSTNWIDQIGSWLGSLSDSGKVIVAIIAVFVTLAVLSIVLQLISLAIRFAVLGLILFLVYRFFFRPKST